MMDDLMFRALVAGAGVAALAGMLGTLVVWRRMAYVSDAMGHGALVGVVLGLIAGLDATLSVGLIAVLYGLILSIVSHDKRLPFDAMLVVLSTGGLAGGLLLLDWLPRTQVDVFSYLFGDVLSMSMHDIWLIFGALMVECALIIWLWRPILRMILHPDVAQVEGVPVKKLSALLMVMIALIVAVTLQVVGVLLITALLVIPPLTARAFARTPAQMVVLSGIIGVLASQAGVIMAFHFDVLVGPSIIMCALALFAISRFAPKTAL